MQSKEDLNFTTQQKDCKEIVINLELTKNNEIIFCVDDNEIYKLTSEGEKVPGEVFAKMYDVDDVLNTKFKLISNKQKGMSRDKFFDELFELLKIQIESINEIIDEESLNLA